MISGKGLSIPDGLISNNFTRWLSKGYTLGGASIANIVPLSKACGTRVRRAKAIALTPTLPSSSTIPPPSDMVSLAWSKMSYTEAAPVPHKLQLCTPSLVVCVNTKGRYWFLYRLGPCLLLLRRRDAMLHAFIVFGWPIGCCNNCCNCNVLCLGLCSRVNLQAAKFKRSIHKALLGCLQTIWSRYASAGCQTLLDVEHLQKPDHMWGP